MSIDANLVYRLAEDIPAIHSSPEMPVIEGPREKIDRALGDFFSCAQELHSVMISHKPIEIFHIILFFTHLNTICNRAHRILEGALYQGGSTEHVKMLRGYIIDEVREGMEKNVGEGGFIHGTLTAHALRLGTGTLISGTRDTVSSLVIEAVSTENPNLLTQVSAGSVRSRGLGLEFDRHLTRPTILTEALRGSERFLQAEIPRIATRFSGSPEAFGLLSIGFLSVRAIRIALEGLSPDLRIHMRLACVDTDSTALGHVTNRLQGPRSIIPAHGVHAHAVENFGQYQDGYHHVITIPMIMNSLDEDNARVLLANAKRHLKIGGIALVGNFLKNIPEEGGSNLNCFRYLLGVTIHQRNEMELSSLARAAGFSPDEIEIAYENTGMIAFLRLTRKR